MQLFTLSPWVTMWNHPRRTIRNIVDSNPNLGFFRLSALVYFHMFLLSAPYFSLSLGKFLLFLLFAPFLGALWIYFHSAFLYITGKWLGGVAPFSHIRAAIAWSSLPFLIEVFVWGILLIFASDALPLQPKHGPVSFLQGIVLLTVSIWVLVLFLQSLREVQKFSLFRSLFNAIFAFLLQGIFIIGIVLFVAFLIHLAGFSTH